MTFHYATPKKYNSTTANFSSFSPYTLTPPQPLRLTSQRLSLPKEELHCSLNTRVWRKHNRHHSTVRSILLLHTHSHFRMLPRYSCATRFNCCNSLVSPRACCLIFWKPPFRARLSQSVRHQSEHLYTVPAFCFAYIKKRLTMFTRTSHYTTSLGNVGEFGVPFVR